MHTRMGRGNVKTTILVVAFAALITTGTAPTVALAGCADKIAEAESDKEAFINRSKELARGKIEKLLGIAGRPWPKAKPKSAKI